MEALKRSYIYIFAAGMYFYHLGAWTYRVEGFTLSEVSAYPEVAQITYAYLIVIVAFLASGFLSALGKETLINLIYLLIAVPVIYEIYRIAGVLMADGSVESELFNAHLGVRLGLGAVVALCVFHSTQLRKSFNKAIKRDGLQPPLI